MRGAIRTLTSLDTDDLERWTPTSKGWAVGIRLVAGPEDGPGEESFDLTVCNSVWLTARIPRDGVFDGRHHLVVEHFNWPTLRAYIQHRVERAEGESWRDVAEILARLGYWEFEDYRP